MYWKQLLPCELDVESPCREFQALLIIWNSKSLPRLKCYSCKNTQQSCELSLLRSNLTSYSRYDFTSPPKSFDIKSLSIRIWYVDFISPLEQWDDIGGRPLRLSYGHTRAEKFSEKGKLITVTASPRGAHCWLPLCWATPLNSIRDYHILQQHQNWV